MMQMGKNYMLERIQPTSNKNRIIPIVLQAFNDEFKRTYYSQEAGKRILEYFMINSAQINIPLFFSSTNIELIMTQIFDDDNNKLFVFLMNLAARVKILLAAEDIKSEIFSNLLKESLASSNDRPGLLPSPYQSMSAVNGDLFIAMVESDIWLPCLFLSLTFFEATDLYQGVKNID